VTLGRALTNTVVLDDPAVSRRHALIERVDGHLVLTDLGSGNGTYVNDERITRTPLRLGDRLQIGCYRLVVDPPRAAAPAATLVVSPDQLRAARATLGIAVPPARRVVEAAEAHNRTVGHELDGFLSRQHGFLPVSPPETAFPASHAAWDDLVGRLPELFRSLGLRRTFDRLPVLDASPEALPDRYLLRASTMLGVFAHAYHYLTIDPPAALPPSLLQPWTTVSTRLGKAVPAVSYIDLFFYNWRLRDPAGPRQLDNLDLLVPTWDNAAERIFYLVTTEFAMALTPALGAMVDAQQAVLEEDRGGVEAALLVILETLRHVSGVIWPQIDPNPLGRTHLDHVVWAKTVGTSGVPILDGAPSPSGTAQPHIHALDAFLGRESFDTVVGRQSVYLAGHFPRHWSEFIAALRAISVRDFVEHSGDRNLRGLYNAVLDAYVGDRGWMGVHRIKAYGFLEVAFKVGRQVTTGARFTGLFKDRTWDRVDDELAAVREERRPAVGPPVVFARPRGGRLVRDPASELWTGEIELDVAGQGVHYRPGDRVGVLPENDDDLVHRTVRALQATGDEIVQLTPAWQRMVGLRAGYSSDTAALPLQTLLTFARIRPVDRTVAKRLLAVSASGALRRVVDARMEDQWELWDLLNLVSAGGYDVARLWTAGPDEAESLCRIVPPEGFRLYSIASAMPPDEEAGGATSLRLVVAGLSYRTPRTAYSYPHDRRGTGSWFLRRLTDDPRHRNRRLSLRIVPAPRFRLPEDASRPVVMFAGGSGLAPFAGFAEARAAQPGAGENVLFLATRTADEFIPREPFERLAARGRLHLHTAFSRVDVQARFDPAAGHYVPEPARRRRIDDLLRDPERADELWELLRDRPDGGRGGCFYVCGRAGFAASVLQGLTDLAAARLGSAEAAAVLIRRLTAEGRLLLDVFTTYGGHAQEGVAHDVSDLVAHTTLETGCWMAIDGKVYDVTEFIHLHPGGPHLVRHYLGLDATGAYRKVLHHQHSEVDALLAMYERGTMRRLHFDGAWGVVLTAEGLRYTALEDFFTAWVRYAYLVVGMADALRSDYGFAGAAATRGETPGQPTRFTAQFLIEAHRRFLVSYLDGLLDEDLRDLWATAVGFCAHDLDVRALAEEITALSRLPESRLVRRSLPQIKRLLLAAESGGWDTGSAVPPPVQTLCEAWGREDVQVLQDIVEALRGGLRAFERHEAAVAEHGADELLSALRGVPAAVASYYRRVAALTAAAGITAPDDVPDVGDDPVPEDRGIPGHGGPV
jgi:sulfite reductase alpha subunit-like flavoprotein/cytochrome b involved in lipid metabolism